MLGFNDEHCKQIVLVIVFPDECACYKGKIFYGQEPPVENLLPQNPGSIINYLQ